MRKKYFLFGLIISFIFSINSVLEAQLLSNKGAVVNVKDGVLVLVQGSVENKDNGFLTVFEESGVISEMIIRQDFINNATAGGSGYYRVLGDWENNNTFNAGTGSVFMEGDNQLLTGIVSTYFYNLILDGTGIKTQTIDQYVLNTLDLKHLELSTEDYIMFVENPDVDAVERVDGGFVSSLGTGVLSRNTQEAETYLFPVGSSLGVNRYRPVEITPNNPNDNTYTVRMANVDATDEDFNRDLVEPIICETNQFFYHRINRTSGTTAIDLKIFYNETEDGEWDGIANWTTSPDEWQVVQGSTTTTESPLSYAYVDDWDSFDETPYILHIVNPSPVIDPIPPICIDDDEIILTGEPEGGTWSGEGVTGNVFDPSEAGIGFHEITYEVIDGTCSASVQIIIEVTDYADATITPVGPFCYDNFSVTLSADTEGGTWTGEGITDNELGTFNIATAGVGTHEIIYEVFGTCGAVDTTEIIIYPSDIMDNFIVEDPLCIGGNGIVEFSATGGTSPYTYLVNGEQYTDTEYIAELSAGDYTITIVDTNGCIKQTDISINEGTDDCIEIPNAFTPNGDGINDEWLIQNIEAFPDAQIQVFNRWGQLVYLGRHGDDPWNGTYEGMPLPVGPYVYVIKLNHTDDKQDAFVGIVTLIR